ncbi:MAG TPA: adenosine deaminase [Acidimicrobiales bacterium]|nr:adenosine deaminase [Acidimicrobiales bacterium]
MITDPSPHAAFIAGLPKVELHVHHVGSASPQIVAELAERHPGAVPSDTDELADFFTFTDFDDFIERYLAVANLITTPEDVQLLTYGVATEMAAQQIRYAELTATPYTSVLAGIPIEAFVEAIEDGRTAAERDHGIEIKWIFDIPGEVVPNASAETARLAVDHGPDSLIGFGLGGPEVGTTRPRHKDAFDRARAAGLHSVPHAGETTGPQTIWDALDALGAERIGHGTSAVQDPALLSHLAERRIPLEVCPTSNIATRCVASYEMHPLRALVDAGVHVTINSDDPHFFATTLCREYEIAAALLDLDEAGIAQLARDAVEASFLPAGRRTSLVAEIDAYLATFLAGVD